MLFPAGANPIGITPIPGEAFHMRYLNVALSIAFTCLLVMPAAAFNGSQLARASVEDFSLTTQEGLTYELERQDEPVIVVSFIFTRCPDVCPVITQLLSTVQNELTEEQANDVQFVSITVDPEHDTPERLLEYTQRHGVEWPHLTGEREHLENVWANFALVVQQQVIDAHVMEYQPGEASVTVVNTNNTSSQSMFAWNGYTATTWAAEEMGLSLNVSNSDFGHFLSGINGTDSPSDWSWYWELNVWNAANETWEASTVGMDTLDVLEHPHIAWKPSYTNTSLIPAPASAVESTVTVQWSNTSSQTAEVSEFTGHHVTHGALNGAGINVTMPDSNLGHYLTSINNQSGPDDFSWWWNLYAWNDTDNNWTSSEVGMDSLMQPHHLAWAPSNVNVSTIPSPIQPANSTTCDGHGWEMGSGTGLHCMCDAGYTWDGDDRRSCVPETTEEYNVGHSTITYILNQQRQPVVAWTGDSWAVNAFTEDVREVLRNENAGGYDEENTPWASSALTLTGLMAAAAFFPTRRKDESADEERKGEKEGPTASA